MKSRASYNFILVLILLSFWTVIIYSPAKAETPFGSIKTVKDIPIHGVKIIESDKGVFFVSENGRFAWKGPILDMWNSKEIRTIEDTEEVVNHIDLKKLGINPSKLPSLTIGKGKKEEVIFASPECPHCRDLLQQAVKLDLDNEYRFVVVLLPMGKNGMEHTKKLLCGADQGAAVKALVSGNYDNLQSEECKLSFQNTIVVAKILGLSSVPYLIRHDGKGKSGELKNLAAWLEAADQAKKEKTRAKEVKKP